MGNHYLLVLVLALASAKGSFDAITITRVIDSSEPYHKGGEPENTFDGSFWTIWNSMASDNSQYYNKWFITFELAERSSVMRANLLNDGDFVHDIKTFKLESSDDLETWHMGGITSDVEPDSNDWQSFDIFTSTGKYLRFTVTETWSGWQPWLREISFSGYTGPYDVVTIDGIVDSCGPSHLGGGPGKTIDGKENTHWNPDIPQYYNNWYITFALAERSTVTTTHLLNYGDEVHDLTKFKLEASDDNVNWHRGGSVSDVHTGTRDWQSFSSFKATGKYLRFTITETSSGWQPWLPEISFTGYTDLLNSEQ